MRLSGVTVLTPWTVVALYTGAVAGMVGVNLFLLGIVFNYLIALFRGRPVQQGLFGRKFFDSPLDRHFGWMGIGSFLAGLAITGVALVIFWIIFRVLDELNTQSAREDQSIGQDQEPKAFA